MMTSVCVVPTFLYSSSLTCRARRKSSCWAEKQAKLTSAKQILHCHPDSKQYEMLYKIEINTESKHFSAKLFFHNCFFLSAPVSVSFYTVMCFTEVNHTSSLLVTDLAFQAQAWHHHLLSMNQFTCGTCL